MAEDKYTHFDIPAVERSGSYQDGLGRDPEMEGLTLYEKKALLVNRELDAHGMGKYQWYIWFLCGFGYMLDLLWAQAFGLVAAPLQQELGFSGTRIPCSSEDGNTCSQSSSISRSRTREHLCGIFGRTHGRGEHTALDGATGSLELMRKLI